VKFFDNLENVEKAYKLSIFANIAQFVIILFSIMMIMLATQTKVIEVKIPPGDFAGETFKIGINDASNETFEVWGEVFANTGGSYSPGSIEDKVKWLEKFVVPDRQFIVKTDFDKLVKNVKDNFITSKFHFKMAKVERKPGYVTVKVYGDMDRWVGTDQIMDRIPYRYEIDMVVKNGNILFGRFAGTIEEDRNLGGNEKGKIHKEASEYVNFK